MLAWIVFILTVVITIWILYNHTQWGKMPDPNLQNTLVSEQNFPFVSILVPARNEERVIEKCLTSLLNQDYPHFEVICLNDHSEDRTQEIIANLQNQYPRLKMITGKQLPPDWVGKNHACHQLSQYGHGELYLFTDADTIHHPLMLKATVHQMQKDQSSLLTGFPKVQSSHVWGWLILPMLFFVIVLHLPLRFVSRSQDPRFVAAHGAFLLFRKKDYEAIGGHQTHRQALVEDMVMAKAIKKIGKKVSLVNITPYVTCDMYARPRDVWEGFSKNIFIGLGASTPLLGMLLVVYFFLYVYPIFAGIYLVWKTEFLWAGLWMSIYLMTCLQKKIVDRAFGTKGHWYWLLPVSFIGMISIAIRSWVKYVSKSGYTWKGRVYRG